VGPNKTRPGDVVIPNWSMGRTAAIDVTVIHPVQLNTIQMAVQSGTEPMEMAEEAKIIKYGEACASNELDFIPFGMSTYGGYGPSALKTLKVVTRRVTARSTLPPAVIATNIHQQFAVRLTKSISSSIIARDPCPPNPLIFPLPKNNTATPTAAPPQVIFKHSNFFVPRHPPMRTVETRCTFTPFPALVSTVSNKAEVMATPNSYTKSNCKTTPEAIEDAIILEDEETDPESDEDSRSLKPSPNRSTDITPKTPTPYKGMSVRVCYPEGWYTGKVKKVKGKEMNVKFFDGTFIINWEKINWKVKE